MFKKAWMLGLLTALLCSCSDDSPGASPARCVQGKIESCPCAGSEVTGTQTCQADGSFSACLGCPGGEGEGGASAGGKGQGGKSTGGKGGSASTAGGQGGEAAGEAGQSSEGGQAGVGQSGSGGSGNQGGAAAGAAGSGAVDDADQDGWTKAQGDCDDGDPGVNPGAAELLERGADGKPTAAQIDNDCDGKAASPDDKIGCDAGLGLQVTDAFDAARAVGLCAVKVDEGSKKWGVIGASLSDIAGNFLGSPVKQTAAQAALSYGILPDLGPNSRPREGERLLAMSSGIARAPGQEGGVSDACAGTSSTKNYTSSFPPGFPKANSQGCETPGQPYDGVALDLRIRVPTNARAMRFKYRFFSCDYPEYTCQEFNDVFAVIMAPSPLPPGDVMSDSSNASGNIAFEGTGLAKNVIGVNNKTLLSACEPDSKAAGYSACQAGNGSQLAGSGFAGHGATSWVVTQTPVPPGEVISLRLAIWDSYDAVFDSTVLVDGFEWVTEGSGPVSVAEGEALPGAGGAGGFGPGGAGGQAGGSLFGGSGGQAGESPFGGTSGAGGTGTAAGAAGSFPGIGPCSSGACAGPNECCLDDATDKCGTPVGGLVCF